MASFLSGSGLYECQIPGSVLRAVLVEITPELTLMDDEACCYHIVDHCYILFEKPDVSAARKSLCDVIGVLSSPADVDVMIRRVL
jgi:hypothetical protein